MLILNLNAVLADKSILQPSSYLTEQGFPYRVAYGLTRKNVLSLKLKHLEKLCLVLSCTPDDLFRWIPENQQQIEKDHPMNKLKREQVLSLTATLNTLSMEKVNAVKQFVQQLNEESSGAYTSM